MSYYYPEGYFGPICDSEVNPPSPPAYVPPTETIEEERTLRLDGRPFDETYFNQYFPNTPQLYKILCKFDADGVPSAGSATGTMPLMGADSSTANILAKFKNAASKVTTPVSDEDFAYVAAE